MKENLIQFFLKRYIAKTPWALRLLTIVLAIASFLCGLPALLEYLCSSEIQICVVDLLPESWIVMKNKAVAIACLVLTFITELGVEESDD